MTITILILAYGLWLGDWIKGWSGKSNNSLISGALVTLLSWSVLPTWGKIVCGICIMVCLGSIIVYKDK